MLRLMTAAGLAILAVLTTLPSRAAAAEEIGITGTYDSEYILPDGTSRKGDKVVITKDDRDKDVFLVTWGDERGGMKGIGIIQDQILSVSYVVEFFSAHPRVDSYKIGKDKLDGKSAGGKGVVKIVLTRRK
jgi:hypothetical protein